MKLSIAFALLLAASVQAQDFKFLPWKYDRWNSTDGLIMKSDKAEHAIRDGFIFWALGKTNLVGQYRFGVTTVLATGWEIRDGFAWRKTDGYSWKDLFAGMAGQGLIFAGEKLFSKPKKNQARYDEALRQELEALRARVKELERNKIVITPSPMPSILPYNDNQHFQPVPLRRTDVPHVILNIDSLGATFSVDSSFTIIGESKIK